MLKSCGKHVNNQRIERRTSCETLSTQLNQQYYTYKNRWTNPRLFQATTHITHNLITSQKYMFNRLLTTPFPHFPQSLLILRPYKYLKKG